MSRLPRTGYRHLGQRGIALLQGSAKEHAMSGLLLLPCLVLWLWLAACQAEPQANRYAPAPIVAKSGDGTPPIRATGYAGSSVYSETQDIGISVPTPFRASAEALGGTGSAGPARLERPARRASPDEGPIDDAGISADTEAVLRATPGLDVDGIRVDTREGSVLLTGRVASANLSNRASAATRTVDGVSHVDNRLTVSP